MAFFVTARLTALYSALFEAMGQPVVEMHSRKSQSARTKAADAFRNGTRCIMFSSDVSARGVDYPDVTLVLQARAPLTLTSPVIPPPPCGQRRRQRQRPAAQVGLPSEKAQYVHRVGRTARAGKTGQGLILLADFESHFLRQLGDLPLSPAPAPPDAAGARAATAAGLARVDAETKAQAYRTWLGFYKGYVKACGWGLPELVQQANHFARVIGAAPPAAAACMPCEIRVLRG